MKHKLEVARRIMRYVYNYMLVLFFTSFALYLLRHGEIGIKEALILAGAMGVSWILRERTGKNIILFLVHMAMIAGVIFIEKGATLKTVMAVALFVVMVFAMRYNRSGGRLNQLDEVPWPMFLAGMVMYVFGIYMNNRTMVFKSYLIPVILFIAYLIIVYLDGMYNYIDRTKDVADLPVRRMMSVNSVIVTGIVSFIIVAIAITSLFNLDGLIKGFFKGVLTICGFIILGFADSLTTIVIVALVIVAAVFIFYIVKKIVRFIILKRHMPEDVIESLTENTRDQKEKRKTFRESVKERLSMDEKVRRVYRKTVLAAGRPYVPLENETTLDINGRISVNSKYDLTDMTGLYNELRYGQTVPDRKAYSEMKKRARHIGSNGQKSTGQSYPDEQKDE